MVDPNMQIWKIYCTNKQFIFTFIYINFNNTGGNNTKRKQYTTAFPDICDNVLGV